MFVEERHEKILNLLERDKKIYTNKLAENFKVSIDTIRRDLGILEKKGLLKRTHGGAIEVSRVREKSTHSTAREVGDGTIDYNLVAEKAASFIDEGDTIYIGGASLHYILLKYLPRDINYTVVTNSIIVAEKLREYTNIEVFMVCGKLRSSGVTVDPFAANFISTLRIDKAFIAAGGLSLEHGLSTITPELASFIRAVVKVSKKKICLSPNNRIGVELFVRAIDAEQIDVIITDYEANDEEVKKLQEVCHEIIIVK